MEMKMTNIGRHSDDFETRPTEKQIDLKGLVFYAKGNRVFFGTEKSLKTVCLETSDNIEGAEKLAELVADLLNERAKIQ